MSSELEQAFIQLAVGNGIRRVQTPEGARFYGQPVGTIITPDLIKKARAHNKSKGIQPPKGGLSPKAKTISTGKASPASNFNANPSKSTAKPKPKSGSGSLGKFGTQFDPTSGKMKPGSSASSTEDKFQVKPPTIKGPNNFKVGESRFSAPAGSKLFRSKKQPSVAYVYTPDGEVHAFNPSGEIDLDAYADGALKPVLQKKFKDLKSDDSLYTVENFDGSASLSDQKPGAVLSKNGKPAFRKTESGTWLNEDIGVELTDDDLQSSYEAGKFDLEPSTTVEDVDFANLTLDELEGALEAMPEGKQLKFGSGDNPAILTKEKGKWKSDKTGASLENASLADVAEGTTLLSDKLDVPAGTPNEPAKSEKAAKNKKATDPLMNSENEISEANTQKKKAKAAILTGADISKSKAGDVVYHDQVGAITKTDKDQWVTTQGVSFPNEVVRNSANLGYLSTEPWNEQQLSDKETVEASNKLIVDGKELSTIAKFGENDRSESIKADGGSTPPVFELEATPENAKTFRDAMKKSLEGNPYAASVYIYDEEDYAGMRLFLADDGKSGVALHDGDEIVSVFSDPKSKNEKVARHLISVAVENGGKRLDAFDTKLPEIYAKEGFQVKARLKWNDEYAPNGWDKKTFSKYNNGEPDVVFMQHEPGMEDLDYEPGSGDYVEDYDAGLASTGGKAQDSDDYRPESGDPDNDESEVETTANGWVVSEDVNKALAEGMKITAIKALMDANPDKPDETKLKTAKLEIEKMMSDGIAPGTPFKTQMLWDLPQGSKFRTSAGIIFTKNENGNWVTPNGGVYTSQEMSKSSPNGAEVTYNPNYTEKIPKASSTDEDFDPNSDDFDFVPENPVPDEDFDPIPENGTPVSSLEDFVPGDELNVQTSDGTITLKNISNGEWEETKNGYIFKDEDVLWDADQGRVWMDADQVKAVQNNIDTKNGVVKSLKHKFLPGDWIMVNEVPFQKNTDGTWSANGEEGYKFTDADFASDLDAGLVKKGPKANKAAVDRTFAKHKKDNPAYADEPIPAGAPKIVDETPSKGFKNTTQTQEAINALESHSGFQIKYGLKSLSEDHPLKDQEFLDETVAKAKQQYPDLPPKKALVKHLKFTLGQDDNIEDWEKDLLESNTEKHQIGSRSPKDTATGVTGGSFSTKDIQGAVDILEGYDGKLFKNELNKKGNPLGKLSPNHIVGFDKDKTVTKQKFIDALKKKIEPKEAPKPQGPDNNDLDYSDTPETGKVVAASFEMSALANAPEGSHIGMTNSIGKEAVFRKDADGKWYNDALLPKKSDSILFYNLAMQGKLKWADAPSESESPKAPEVGEKVSYEQVADLPVGTEIATPSGTVWTKINNSKYSWQTESPSNGVGDTLYENKDLKPFIQAGNGTFKKVGSGSAKNVPSTSTASDSNVLTDDMIDDLPDGAWVAWKGYGGTLQYYHKEGDKFQRYLPNGKKDGNLLHSSNLKGFPSGSLTKPLDSEIPGLPNNKPLEDGDVVTNLDQLKRLPIGATIVYTPNGDLYVKMGDDQWKTDISDASFQDDAFSNAIKAGNLEYKAPEVKSDGSLDSSGIDEADSLDDAINAHFEQMKELDKATSILPPEERGANGDGFVIVHTEDGPKITWGKYGGGGIATVATDENGVKKVLIGKRGDRDEWYLPGGAIDEKETHLQGSLREFSEEVADGDAILDNITITNAFQAVIGKIEGTDKDWKYVTSVASLPNTFDVKAPETSEPWELQEYKWFDADELAALDASGKLHPALGNGNLASMVGFGEEQDLHSEILSLMNHPDDLSTPKYNISNWKKVGGSQGGSNPGGVYEDELGNKFYVKTSNGGDKPAHNEVVAAALYKAAGVNSNEVFLVENNGKMMLASPWVENDSDKVPDMIFSKNSDPEFLKKVQSDFAIDAWLDNYDVVGIGPWNLVADKDGNPFRIDPGGAMMYRATGAEKSWWGDDPTSIDDMRLGSTQSSAYTHLPKIFGNMNQTEIRESAKKLLAITPKQIQSIVNSSGLDEDTKAKLYQTLVVRRQKILERFDLDTPEVLGKNTGLPLSKEVQQLVKENKTIQAIKSHRENHPKILLSESKYDIEGYAEDLKAEEAKKAAHAPAYAKGTVVKVKGTQDQFSVELSTNEASAGKVNGKFLVFLNDELTSDLSAPSVEKYAFTSDGETFAIGETVTMPDPENSAAQIDALVVKAEWSSGLVAVINTNNNKVLEVDKTHLKKKESSGASLQEPVMPPGYSKAPEGSKPHSWYQYDAQSDPVFIVQLPNGEAQVFNKEGDSWTGAHTSSYDDMLQKDPEKWHAWDGSLVDTNAPASTETLNLGEGYAVPPVGSKVLAKNSVTNAYVVKLPNGDVHYYDDFGTETNLGASEQDFTEPNGDWVPVDSAATSTPGAPVGPVDTDGKTISKGDTVSIIKYNKKGQSNKAKIVSINEEKGTARVRRLDENGVPLSDENGKPIYATMSLSSLRKSDASALPSNGLPTGITMSEGDKTNALYGTPSPTPPEAKPLPSGASSKPIVSDDWFVKAEVAYAAYREKKSLSPKPLKDSSTAWNPIDKAMKGDQTSLDFIKSKGYLDEDPALYEEIQQAIDANKAKYSDLIAEHEKAVEEYQQKKSEWMTANGVASYTPVRHEDLEQWNTDQSHEWMKKRFSGLVLPAKGKQGLQEQKGSSEWQRIIRKLPAILGLRREDVANAPGVTSSNMKTWDNIKEATDVAGPIGTGFRAVRTISFDRLVGPDGIPLKSSDDLTKIIGSIQKDHGAAEINPNSLYDNGKINDFYPVVMDLAVPPEMKGWYTGAGSFSHGSEYGLILEPGFAMYISDVKQEYVKQLNTTRWVVKASIIPRDVLPYMNNFEGDPMSHNILIPGKDTTTGVPTVPNNAPSVPSSSPSGKKVMEKVELDNFPTGTAIDEINYADEVVHTWTKKFNGDWISETGYVLASIDLSGFNFIKKRDSNSGSNSSSPGKKNGEWTKEELETASVGTTAVDKNGTPWTKEKTNLWVAEDDSKSEFTSDFYKWYMNDPWSELANSASSSLGMPKYPYSEDELIDMAVGSIVTDADNDQWKKQSDGLWIALDGELEGQVRSSFSIASYVAHIDNGI